jgi:hypothetical protein
MPLVAHLPIRPAMINFRPSSVFDRAVDPANASVMSPRASDPCSKKLSARSHCNVSGAIVPTSIFHGCRLPGKGCFDNETLCNICSTDTDGLDAALRELPGLPSAFVDAEVNAVASTNGNKCGSKYVAPGANAHDILKMLRVV